MEGKINASSIQVSKYTKDELRNLETYPKETYNNIVLRLINEHKEKGK